MNNKIIACGLTADNRPNVVISDKTNKPFPHSLWYHTTFHNVNDALDFLKDVYHNEISQNDIDDGLWITLQELQEQGR